MTLNELFKMVGDACICAGATLGFLVSAVLLLIGIATWYMLLALAVVFFVRLWLKIGAIQVQINEVRAEIAELELEAEAEDD